MSNVGIFAGGDLKAENESLRKYIRGCDYSITFLQEGYNDIKGDLRDLRLLVDGVIEAGVMTAEDVEQYYVLKRRIHV
jgi:hypothetical protein